VKLSAEDFIRLLGKPHTDNDVNSLTLSLGIKNQDIRLKRGEYSVNFTVYPSGVELVFSDPADFLTAETLKEGVLIFSTVFFYGDSSHEYTEFKGTLPADLAFTLPRNKVRQILGSTEFSSPILPIDRWKWRKLKLAIDFTEDESQIASISVGYPKTD
jgi:hypothetical protein